MQHLKEFLVRLQTFNLRIIPQDISIYKDLEHSKTRQIDTYDITCETQYYDSFSYKSELRVLKDMAFIDLLSLDTERMELQLEQLRKVAERFKQLWKNWHDHHKEWTQDYKSYYIFTIQLDTLFIVKNLQSDSSGIAISGQFVEDLGDSLKLREMFLKELIGDIEKRLAPPKPTFADFLHSKMPEQMTDESSEAGVEEEPLEEQISAQEAAKPVGHYPTFTAGTTAQLYHILKDYFIPEDHARLEKLLLEDEPPEPPLIFRGQANQLADAFKQLFDARMIVSCRMVDLQKWIAPKFKYINNQSEVRNLSDDYLSGLMSEHSRPCKSPILQIKQKEDKFLILPAPRNKK
ncbi:hypothetical protein [Mucilaginibacter sp. UYCu711]|uniref:hypothetical protein n=1 Tax=Mucilaginibacter sp. UYCu711 TaxID=3156339 RepID=UPI003D22029B